MNLHNSLNEIAEKCVRCGICQSVCPVFTEVRREGAVARGKVTLIKKFLKGEIEPSSIFSTYLLQCLGCGACSENCPNGTKVDELILGIRSLLIKKKGLSLPKWIVFRIIFRYVCLLSILFKTGSLLQPFLFKKIPKESGFHLRFSIPYLDKKRFIPLIKNPFFIHNYPEEIPILNNRGKVGIFVGCSINYLFPRIGSSLIHLLNQNNFSIIIPKNQTCCGLLAYGSGDTETAKFLAMRNIKAFIQKDLDQIIVPCGSCFYFLKEGYLKLFSDEIEAKIFSQKIIEISTFFLKNIDFQRDSFSYSGLRKIRLTFHDSCHLRRKMKIYEEPRTLLKTLPEVELIEMKKPDRCCGMAGSFNFINYKLSQKILRHKLHDIESTHAEGVVTSCMGCLIQLYDGIHQRKTKIKALHLIEVLDKGD